MILVACSCLNVRVHGKGNDLNMEFPKNMGLPEKVLNDVFFCSQIYPITLDLGGLTMSQKSLCQVRVIDNWSITTCTCCMMDICAKSIDDNDKVFVSTKAEINSDHIKALMDSERYSNLFKLILPEINDNFIQNNIGIEFQNGNIDQSIEQVQSQVSSYLKLEQKAMEDRIRRFTEQQQLNYTNLLQKVRKNKQAMVYLMLKCKESQNEKETFVESSVGSPSVLIRDSINESSADSAFDRSDIGDMHQDETKKTRNVRMLRRTVSNPPQPKAKVKRELKRAPNSIDVGGMFDMEEFDTKEYPDYQEDEISDSDNETEVEADEEKADEQLMATSLPVSIPAFPNYSRFSPQVDDEDTDSLPKAPEDIAASMRALACSVRDGTEMFGELPRRRLNTGDLLAFRAF